MHTYDSLMTAHAVEIPAHLEQQAEVPVVDGMQRQGDLLVIPSRPLAGTGKPVGRSGVPVVRGEAGGNTHLLVADGDVRWKAASGQVLGGIEVAEGSAAYLLHPEHGAQGIAPGSYTVHRQREQADAIRLVAD